MTDFADLIRQGAVHAWLFLPSAILLGALHGLEPGHAKTMMASFIIAVRGTMGQAVMLGLAATLSHTAVVWVVALVGLSLGRELAGEQVEGWLQLGSAVIMLGMAAWMLWPMLRRNHHHDHHSHEQDQSHEDSHAKHHSDEIKHRFGNGTATNGQIILFGLTGGLIPCPAAITVLLICLQLREFSLGVTLVLCFSIGLALTLTASGVAAALGVKHLATRGISLDRLAARGPYLSAALILLVATYMAAHGWSSLNR